MLFEESLIMGLGGLMLIGIIAGLYLCYVERCEIEVEETNEDGTSHVLYVRTHLGSVDNNTE